ncbi:MAG: pilus assembly protein, partial [Pseudomonadota bacterium]|nr:pilus assembly protein [Pseudomonadota bacterium]
MAAIEFAIIVPVLLLLLGGLADFALAFRSKGLLASSVAQGAEYAFLAGPVVSAAFVQSVVAQKLALSPADVTVTGPACACVSGTPASATEQVCG